MPVVTVKFVGVVRDITHGATAQVEVASDGTILDVLRELERRYGKRFADTVLCERSGLQGYVKLFLDDEEVDGLRMATTRVSQREAGAVAILYVIPNSSGG